MNSRSVFRGFLWSLMGILVVAHLGGGWYFSDELIADGFVPAPDPMTAPESDVAITEVEYTSPVGELEAWHVPAHGSTWVIHIHGKGATPGEAQHLFAPIQQAGFPQLAITYRNDEGQPPDPSGYYQFGATEWEDVAAAVEFAQDKGARGVVLSGFSTGAAHILSFVSKNDLDVVKGLIFDSPNIDFGDTVDFNASQREMPVVPMTVPGTIAQVAKFFTSLRIGVNWKAIDYLDDADALSTPVLIHHGTVDDTVPIRQSISLAELRPDLVRLVRVPDAGHVGSYETDPEAYVANLIEFLEAVG